MIQINKNQKTKVLLLVYFLICSVISNGQNKKINLSVVLKSSETVDVVPAILKYNKDFAFSFTLDDGHSDAFDLAFRLFNGGHSNASGETYPGLFYSDGCGNLLPFTASIAWFTANSSGFDLHNGTNMEYLSWSQALQLYHSGWSFMNHSYDHSANTVGIDYYWQLDQNNKNFQNRVGKRLQYVVPAGGDENYIIPAFELGSMAVFTSHGSNIQEAESPVVIDDAINNNKPVFWRNSITSDEFNSEDLKLKAMLLFENTGDHEHLWWNEFTHEVKLSYQTGGVEFADFKDYMEFLRSNYGSEGLDNMIFASSVEIFEYLKIRDNVKLKIYQNGNLLEIELDYSDCPDDLRYYDISLLLSGAEIDRIQTLQVGEVSFSNSEDNGSLLNFKLPNSFFTGVSNIDFESKYQWTVYPNPTIDYINISCKAVIPEDLNLYLFDIVGRTIPVIVERTGLSSIQIKFAYSNLEAGQYVLIGQSDGNTILSQNIILE